MDAFRLTAIAFSLTLLVACGGGGGGGGGVTGGGARMPPPPPPPLDLPGQVVDPELARTHLRGDEPRDMGSDAIIDGLASEARANGTSPLFSRVVNLRTPDDRSVVVCSGGTCTARITGHGGTNRFSLARFGQTPQVDDVDLERFNQEYQLVMRHRRFDILQSRGVGLHDDRRLEFQGYGGWLDGNSVFGVQRMTTRGNDSVVLLSSYSFGSPEPSNPGPTGGQTSATWNGVMVGAITSADNNDIVQGNATITINDFLSMDVDVEFSNIRNLDTPDSMVGTNGTMTWTELTLEDGAFDNRDKKEPMGSIEGRFYGTSHEAVGGVFERDEIVGAFGATR